MTTPPAAAVLTVVGSGTLVPSADRGSACHHVALDGVSLLMDCGTGSLHGLARCGVDWAAISHVAVTHGHYDHVGDLPALLVALKYGLSDERSRPLGIFGPLGFEARLVAWTRALDIDFLSQPFPLEISEVAPGEVLALGEGATLSATATAHTETSLGYRVDGTSASVGYTGDTGPADGLRGFFRGVDVLVAECAHPDPSPTTGHLTPTSLASLAEAADPGLLLVTHVYPPTAPADVVRCLRERWAGRVEAATDGMVVRIDSRGPAVDLPPRRR